MTDPTASSSTQSQAGPSDPSRSKPAGSSDNNQKSDKPSGTRRQHGRREDTPDVRISKALSYILRHGAAKESLTIRPDGFVRVDELVRLASVFSDQYTT